MSPIDRNMTIMRQRIADVWLSNKGCEFFLTADAGVGVGVGEVAVVRR